MSESNDYLRRPIFPALKSLVKTGAEAERKRDSRAWPCTVLEARDGLEVKVSFTVDTVHTLAPMWLPVFGPPYIRYPLQPGDTGLAIPSDVTLGSITAFGPSTQPREVKLEQLTNLVFLAVQRRSDVTMVNQQQLELYGPEGVLIHDTQFGSLIRLTPGEVVVERGLDTVTITGSGIEFVTPAFQVTSPAITLNGQVTCTANLTVGADMTASGKSYLAHVHSGVQNGPSNTGTLV